MLHDHLRTGGGTPSGLRRRIALPPERKSTRQPAGPRWGNLIGWVAIHRRHHAFTDQPGDPHSPYRYGTGLRGQLRGLAHAHLGWLFSEDRTLAINTRLRRSSTARAIAATAWAPRSSQKQRDILRQRGTQCRDGVADLLGGRGGVGHPRWWQ